MPMYRSNTHNHAPWEAYVVPAPRAVIAPRPATYEVVIERGLRIPMLDGVELAAILWRPARPGPWPVLVERPPHRLEERTGPAGLYHAARGIAVLSVGLRGCAGSGGEFSGPIPGSPTGDGYDTVEWTAVQAWCDGRVGMICGSISGLTAYQTALEAPPHLMPSLVREGPFRFAGLPDQCRPLFVLQAVTVAWAEHRLAYLPAAQRTHLQNLVDTWQQEMQEVTHAAGPDSPFQPVSAMQRHLPLASHPLISPAADYYDDWVGPSDPAKTDLDLLGNAHQVSVPICHLGAWFDDTLPDTLAAFGAMQARAKTADVRKGQRLIIGPWVHGLYNTHGKPVGLLEFGPNAELDFFAFRQRWYDAHLALQSDLLDEPVVWLYLIGPDCWLGFDRWPPPAEAKTLYLAAGGLAAAPPDGAQTPDAYEYDPHDPVPSLAEGGVMGSGLDQRPVEDRLLCYTSPPLDAPLTLVGPVQSILYASSSAPDTDWIVRLTMVRPDGASIILSGGTLRARYHRSLSQPVRLQPEQPERFEIEMTPVSIVIPAGCALRLTVTSSDFPLFDRNLNTGGPIGHESVGQVALNRVYHDAQLPSHVVLPVLRPGQADESS